MPEDPLPLPDFVAWPTFPFEGDLRVKRLEDPAYLEPPRDGEDPSDCLSCSAPDEGYIWVSDRWRVRSLDRPTGLPVVLLLETRSHFDLGDLPNMLAAELGVMTVRLERAIRSLDGVARVHVNRWGDGSAHLHLWFLARPYGHLQLRGEFLSLWDEILPPIPEYQWRENLALIAAWLGDFDGRPLAEPPHLDWKSPATLASLPPSFTSADDERDRLPVGAGDGTDRASDASETLAGSRAGEPAGSRVGQPARHRVDESAAPPVREPAGTVQVAAVRAGAGAAPTGDPAASGGSPQTGGANDRVDAARTSPTSEPAGTAVTNDPAGTAVMSDPADTTVATAPAVASSGARDAGGAGGALPEEFATVREVRVAPGPSGFTPITESPVRSATPAPTGTPAQDATKLDDPVRPVPGQRDGSTQQRNRPAAPLA